MYTRCLACHTVHPVNAAVLSQGGGRFRCGKCHKVGNALEALFDEWPQASQRGTRPGDLPELGLKISLGSEEDSEPTASEAEAAHGLAIEETHDAAARWPWQRFLWAGTALPLAIIITINLAGFFQQPLPNLSRLQSTLVRLGLKQAPPEPAFRSPDRIELISREMKTHPSRPGVLLLTATIVNRAEHTLPYPGIDLTLLDIRGRPLSRQVFKSADYLNSSSELRDGMGPQAYFTLSLEVPDPGAGAVGFELQFH